MIRRLVIFPVRVYQKLIAPWLPPACRYEPSCSRYMIQAIEKHGVIKGVAYGAWRLLRCAPWGGHGYDPVP